MVKQFTPAELEEKLNQWIEKDEQLWDFWKIKSTKDVEIK